jgi:hypothetical protein
VTPSVTGESMGVGMDISCSGNYEPINAVTQENIPNGNIYGKDTELSPIIPERAIYRVVKFVENETLPRESISKKTCALPDAP